MDRLSRICRGCWDQMHVPIPIRGPLAVPFRIVGISRSRMNPNICTICERAFRRVQKQKHISTVATILFADIRGYTRLSERLEPLELSEIVSAFHDQCARGIWAHDGIVNKQMGDGLMAIFNFPIKVEAHAEAAIAAALDIQRLCKAELSRLAARLDLPPGETVGVGVGIHSGKVEIGEFSTDHSEFTAIGGTVNLASRLESAAAAGEVIVSSECAALAPQLAGGAVARPLTLKGIEQPLLGHVIAAAA
ncbi:adenylate/guanylate cyclase domain-containing protein [Oceanibacterium hippocampi]|uniref:Adenylate cyclase 1 n=1 Tax=Oceanibacterium hippocampi TaxID=745714 RepID=A0A1Y5SUW1_9PROT|nr:adenylate/guanylate cyclase domain-containing protein [Oceanibacterium hippocampi]SLN45540.1 Adenylate cyclase 1 [Oceanibacterium hippocampi]